MARGLATPRYSRRIVEFCCGPNSRIGQRAPPDCEVVRLTADDDLTTQEGLDKALAAVSESDVPVLLFGALPCTGGSLCQHVNWYRGAKTRSKIRAHWALFRVLWRNFVIVADACIQHGGRIAIEWPRSCMYWRHRYVKSTLKRWDCTAHRFDGCMYGLVGRTQATEGIPLRKPWTVASNCPDFRHICRLCDHAHGHARIQGGDTKSTEGYTDELADAVHDCWRQAQS